MTQVEPPRVGPPRDLDRIVVQASADAGFRATRYRCLRHFANAVYLVEDVPVVVRVAYGHGAVERSTRAVTIARWLGAEGLPVTDPADVGDRVRQPIVVDSDREVAVTFWRYHPQPDGRPPNDFRALAGIARALHRLRASPPIPLPLFQPLRSLTNAVAGVESPDAIGKDRLEWLRQRIGELVGEYGRLRFPLGVGFIHGDLHAGNLLRAHGDEPVVLGDWDSVCVGPREVDLAPTFTATRFGLDPAAVDLFATSYGYDLRAWSGYATLRAIRELSTLTALVRLAPIEPPAARELHYRVDSLRRGNTNAIWTRQ